MKLYTERISRAALRDATAGLGPTVSICHWRTDVPSRVGRHHVVYLTGGGQQRTLVTEYRDPLDYNSATWDEWNTFVARLYLLDPELVVGSRRSPTYECVEHFRWSTRNRFDLLAVPTDGPIGHRRHTWRLIVDGYIWNEYACLCGATRRKLAQPGARFSDTLRAWMHDDLPATPEQIEAGRRVDEQERRMAEERRRRIEAEEAAVREAQRQRHEWDRRHRPPADATIAAATTPASSGRYDPRIPLEEVFHGWDRTRSVTRQQAERIRLLMESVVDDICSVGVQVPRINRQGLVGPRATYSCPCSRCRDAERFIYNSRCYFDVSRQMGGSVMRITLYTPDGMQLYRIDLPEIEIVRRTQMDRSILRGMLSRSWLRVTEGRVSIPWTPLAPDAPVPVPAHDVVMADDWTEAANNYIPTTVSTVSGGGASGGASFAVSGNTWHSVTPIQLNIDNRRTP